MSILHETEQSYSRKRTETSGTARSLSSSSSQNGDLPIAKFTLQNSTSKQTGNDPAVNGVKDAIEKETAFDEPKIVSSIGHQHETKALLEKETKLVRQASQWKVSQCFFFCNPNIMFFLIFRLECRF